jgi:integrase
VRQRYLEHSPVKAVTAPPDQEPRHRVLSEAELRKLMPAIRLRRLANDHYGAILELLLFTGQRRTQIAALSTRNVDRGAGVLQWRPEEMKGKKRHLIPLTDQVAEILDQFPPGANGLFFPNSLGQPFTSWSYHFRKLALDTGFSDFVVHDLRRCVAGNMQRLRVDIATTEKLLAHTAVTGGLVAVYQQHSYVTEMTAALTKWADYPNSLC